ncbi:nickel transport complex protein, NikM subunit, transmembrane [Pedobacter nyackensis]|uniref:Uncharacterized conserved protein, contains GH25 family domain n=1 Tax=Pedobacter nyackensis TaxID=475255 RepID=A0A1W2EPT9_9SPHI|nr:nickel transport complex protein, NikM subunit, transmembrane [Pedobacter nyackensis]SMD11700.1 Uncharacterized conserved protein, contains GH25 family domain [Pedobacter nyackensis]
MKKISFAIVTALLMLGTSNVFAHALWIETPATGKVGQKQTVKVYYGEYADLGRDSVSTWYSDVKEFSLWLVSPDNKKTQLKVTPGVNYFEGSFTPDQNGSFTVMVSHEAKELGGTTKYHFLSSAGVSVGKVAPIVTQNTNTLGLHINDATSLKVKNTVKMNAFIKDAAASQKAVTVFSPTGWSKEFYTDKTGSFEFIPLWPGRYVVEISHMDKTPGKHHDKDYSATWKGATYSFEIN